jgi:hypothetical protein
MERRSGSSLYAMTLATMLLPLLAHGEGEGGASHAGELALTGIAIAAMVIPIVLIGAVGVAFYRSSKRDPDAREREPAGRGG